MLIGIHEIFGSEYIPESFESMNQEKIVASEKMIIKKCFLEVIPRFQNISDGIKVYSKKVFYEYDKNSILVNPYALSYFKENYSLLYKAIILE